MSEGLAELVELYEYKVDDLTAGREPKGGRASVVRLRQLLIKLAYQGPHAKRFRQVDARFRSLNQIQRNLSEVFAEPTEPHPAELGSVFVEEEPQVVPEGPSPERQALEALTQSVYWVRLEHDLERQVKNLLMGKREELRLIYAVLQNLEAYSKTPQFAQDYNLSRFSLSQAIPAISDPLVSFDDPGVAKALLLELFKEAYSLPDRLRLPPEETVAYLRRFMRRVIESEGALRPQGAGRRTSVESLRRALEEAQRMKLPLPEIRALEERLQAVAADERRMSLVLEEDRQRFHQASERLAVLLARYLPAPRGEAAPPQVPAKILWGQDPDLRQEAIGPEDAVVTLRLLPARLSLGGLEILLSETAGEFTLSLEGSDYPLDPAEPLTIVAGGFELWAIRFGHYLHLRLEPREGAHISTLLAEGRVLAHLLRPAEHFGYLRLLRAFSTRLKGPVDYAGFGPETAQRYGEASPEALQDFARKGLEVVRGRISNGSDWQPLLEEVATQLGLERQGRALAQALSDWVGHRPPTRDTLGGVGASTLSEAPASVRLGSVVLSLRYQEDTVHVATAGQVPRRLDDLLVWSVPEGMGVLAREGLRVAYLLLPNTQFESV
ncbi:MAG TPA: hypothetical protein VFS50_06340 [Meiothermus sp.]|nr:hypothetical protein [Meiothermus sp.]